MFREIYLHWYFFFNSVFFAYVFLSIEFRDHCSEKHSFLHWLKAKTKWIYHIVDTVMLMEHKVWSIFYHTFSDKISFRRNKLQIEFRHKSLYISIFLFPLTTLCKRLKNVFINNAMDLRFRVKCFRWNNSPQWLFAVHFCGSLSCQST